MIFGQISTIILLLFHEIKRVYAHTSVIIGEQKQQQRWRWQTVAISCEQALHIFLTSVTMFKRWMDSLELSDFQLSYRLELDSIRLRVFSKLKQLCNTILYPVQCHIIGEHRSLVYVARSWIHSSSYTKHFNNIFLIVACKFIDFINVNFFTSDISYFLSIPCAFFTNI